MTLAIVFHLLAPRAMAASRKALGTERRNSSVLRRVMGIIIRPRAKPPASVEKCLNGKTTRLKAKMQMTMERIRRRTRATFGKALAQVKTFKAPEVIGTLDPQRCEASDE